MRIENISQEEAIKLIYLDKIPDNYREDGMKTFVALHLDSNPNITNLKLEISNSVTRDLPPKPKFNIKQICGGLHLTRMDINEYHTNPEFDKDSYCEILNSIQSSEIKTKMQLILTLMENYSEYEFLKDDYHMHFYINFNYMREDAWAFPIAEFNMAKSENIIESIDMFCKEFNIKLSTSRLLNLNTFKGALNES